MVIILWSRNTASWNENMPGCALWIFFFLNFRLLLLLEAGLYEGQAWREGAPGMGFSVAPPAVSASCSTLRDQCDARSRDCSSLVSGFYWFLFSPLFSVLLTEVVHYQDVGCAERCLAALTPGSQAVRSTSVLYYGGRSVTNGLPTHVTSRASHKRSLLGFLICETGEIVAYTP